MQRYALMLTVALALTASGVALSGEIYKWVDANGNVHYEDRPIGGPSTERVNIASRSTDSSSVQASIDARRERVAARDEAKAKQAEAESEAAKARAEAEDRQQKCTQYRARLETYLQSQRLYREDESGERVYLDEQQMLDARNKAQEKIQEFCD